jgi:hypothetical protein
MSLYDTLHVTSNAAPEVIQSAYRALARAYHPDVNPTAEAASLMQQINAAYAVLIDPERRAQYDAKRARQHRIKRTAWSVARRSAAPRPAAEPPAPSPAAGAISSSEPTVLIPKQCPRLGFADDPASRFLKPTQLHACFATGRSEGVSIHEQRLYCLDPAFVHCPRWIAQVSGGTGAPSASAGETGRGSPPPSEKPFLRAVPRTPRPRTDTTALATREYRWSPRGTPLRSWLPFAVIVAGLILALMTVLMLTFALVADTLDGRSLAVPGRPSVSTSPPDSSSAARRGAHPAAETSTVLPWACAFWRAGQGTSC